MAQPAVGEQYIDLFTAGAYALAGRLYAAVADPSLAWIFYLLATAGIVFAIVQSALDRRPEFWLHHLAAVGVAAVLTLVPQRIDLSTLTYGAPGQVETLFGTRTGAAPHVTYWIERLGATAASALRSLTRRPAYLVVPGVAAQVADIASDPAILNDPQLKANLAIWRRRIVPQLLAQSPGLAEQVRAAGLDGALRNPAPDASGFIGDDAAAKARAVRRLLAADSTSLGAMVRDQSPLLNQLADDAGAEPWRSDETGNGIVIGLVQATAVPAPLAGAVGAQAYGDALQHADALVQALHAQLPDGRAHGPMAVHGVDELYDLLGRSILYGAGDRLARDPSARAAIGSLCQRTSDALCRSAMAPLIDASTRLTVVAADRYNTRSWTTWLEQPIATTLLTITSLLLSTLANLVVSVLPFALGVAKAMAILISLVGAWLLLWPGRAHVALSWMVGPISFVSLWSVLFNLWADFESALTQVAWLIGAADEGSYSARRLMSIAISLGYMGLPSLALGIVYGESGRALYHASARLETALQMAWHTRGSIAAFARRWIVNSPMVRRWNQRAYRAVGMGALRAPPSRASSARRSRQAAAVAPPPAASAPPTALAPTAPPAAGRDAPPPGKPRKKRNAPDATGRGT